MSVGILELTCNADAHDSMSVYGCEQELYFVNTDGYTGEDMGIYLKREDVVRLRDHINLYLSLTEEQ